MANFFRVEVAGDFPFRLGMMTLGWRSAMVMNHACFIGEYQRIGHMQHIHLKHQ
jgi:hypothetical protein